ncbi:hypothetical protein LQZ18_05420 [Lachnospiraceae bacterium ZAX-1]
MIFMVLKGFDAIYLLIPAVAILCLFSALNFQEQWLTVLMDGTVDFFKMLGPILISALMFAGIFGISGAAKSFAYGIMNFIERIVKSKPGDEKKNGIVITVLCAIIIGGVTNFFGLDGMAIQVVVLPILLSMLRHYNLSRNILPALIYANACFTPMPFATNSPMITHAMFLGLPNTGGYAVAGFVGSIAGIAWTFIFLIRYMRKQNLSSEFITAPTDINVETSDEIKLPHFILSAFALVLAFVLVYTTGIQLAFALVIASGVEIIIFFPQLRALAKERKSSVPGIIRENWNDQMRMATYITVMVVMLIGFSNVIQQTSGFQAIIDALTGAASSPVKALIMCTIAMIVMIGITANPMAGMMANLNIISPIFLKLGVPPAAIMRISVTASTVFDTLPTCVGVIMAHKISNVKLKDGYYPVFAVSCIATGIMTVINVIMIAFTL